ncbi:class I SAM-dependent methyltransferase [Chloroflexota bacterium]
MTYDYGGYNSREFVAEYYDPAYQSLRTKDINFFVDYSKASSGSTLELGCGTGRILIPTAVAGCQITGLDLSPHMLKECRNNLAEQPLGVRERVIIVQGNMTSFDTGETYSLVTVPFRAFQLVIDTEEHKSCLGCAGKHLAPGGKLIVDLYHPYPERLSYSEKYSAEREDLPETELPDGRKLRRTNRTVAFHRERQYNDIEMLYYVTHPDGRKERLVHSFKMRYFFRYEMEHLLELCGFSVVDLFGDFDRSEFSSDSPEMIFIAEKK